MGSMATTLPRSGVYFFGGSCRATCVRQSQWIMNVQHSIQQIQEAVALIIPDTLQNVGRYLKYCLDLCRDNKRAHDELLQKRKNCRNCLMLTLFFLYYLQFNTNIMLQHPQLYGHTVLRKCGRFYITEKNRSQHRRSTASPS